MVDASAAQGMPIIYDASSLGWPTHPSWQAFGLSSLADLLLCALWYCCTCAGLQLIGPVAAPLTGGALSSSLSWRATFVFLAAFSACLGTLLYLFLPETHQYYTLKQLADRDPAHLASVSAAPDILAVEPVFQPPWTVLRYVFAPAFAPYVLLNAWAHASLFVCVTLWPLFMVAPPYKPDEALVGVTFLAHGVRSRTGSFVGGFVADKAAKRFAQAPEGRMVYNLAVTALSMP
jgi:predicted MFS family arabinose efflux permease